MDTVPGSLAEAVRSQLADLSIQIGDLTEVNWVRPMRNTLAIGDRLIDVAVLYLPHISATEALRAAHTVPQEIPLLVIGPRVHESSARTLRARGIWYLDRAGNAFMRDDDLLIDIRGRRSESRRCTTTTSTSGRPIHFPPGVRRLCLHCSVVPTLPLHHSERSPATQVYRSESRRKPSTPLRPSDSWNKRLAVES